MLNRLEEAAACEEVVIRLKVSILNEKMLFCMTNWNQQEEQLRRSQEANISERCDIAKK